MRILFRLDPGQLDELRPVRHLGLDELAELGRVHRLHVGTDAAERMEIVAGSCSVKVDGQSAVNTYSAGQAFEVPAKSGFDIEVKSGICEYICSFLG